MPTTAKYKFRYPPGNIVPNVPLSMQQLAEDVEATIAERVTAGSVVGPFGGTLAAAFADGTTPAKVILTPGTYLLHATFSFALSVPAGNTNIAARLVNDAASVVYDTTVAYFSVSPTGNATQDLQLTTVVTLTATTTIKTQQSASPTSGTRNHGGTRIDWVKLA